MDIKEFKREVKIDSAESAKDFAKKYKKEFEKVFSKEFKALDGKEIDFSELMNRVIDEARNTGIDGSKIYKLFKEDFKLNYKDLDKVLLALKEKLIPEDEESEIADLDLKKRQKYIQQIIAAVQTEQEEFNQAA